MELQNFMRAQKALVIEDDLAISQLLKIHLHEMGFEVEVFQDADKAELKLQSSQFAICLLDWMLPTTQGLDFLKKNRQLLSNTKVMMVTAKADADSVVSGLEAGADDYLTKPFDSKVLVARVRNLMRRLLAEKALAQTQMLAQPSEDLQVLKFDGLHLDIAKHILNVNGVDVHLTPSEFKLLAELLKAQGQVLTRDKLIDLIQGEDVSVTGRTIDTHIFALRKKIGTWSKYIETIRGVGYRILISELDRTEIDPS